MLAPYCLVKVKDEVPTLLYDMLSHFPVIVRRSTPSVAVHDSVTGVFSPPHASQSVNVPINVVTSPAVVSVPDTPPELVFGVPFGDPLSSQKAGPTTIVGQFLDHDPEKLVPFCRMVMDSVP